MLGYQNPGGRARSVPVSGTTSRSVATGGRGPASTTMFYLDRFGAHGREAGVGIWAWVPMPNYVHLILTPQAADGLSRALAAAYRANAGRIHARLRRTGHFRQGRFRCVAMDEAHLRAAPTASRRCAGPKASAGRSVTPPSSTAWKHSPDAASSGKSPGPKPGSKNALSP